MTPGQKAEIEYDLRETTNNLLDAHARAFDAQNDLHEAQRALAAAEAQHTLAGLEGKNESARRAELAALTEMERLQLDKCEYAHRAARLDLTQAELNHRLARDLLKLHTNPALEDNT